mgnify:CR=1 FL=1
MKIIIVGAGQVGATLAENLAREYNDITVIDVDEKILLVLQDRLDIRTVTGTGSHPDILVSAGIEDADMLIAVTNSDEVNIIACQVAYSLFHTPTKIARIRAYSYTNPKFYDKLFNDKQTAEDHIEWKASQPSKNQKPNPYKTAEYYVEHRKGDNPRCSGNYCGVAEFCSQYREMLNEQERL